MYPVLMAVMASPPNVSQYGQAAYRNIFIKFHWNPSDGLVKLNSIKSRKLTFIMVEEKQPTRLPIWLQLNLFLAPSINMTLYWFLLCWSLGKMDVECFPLSLQSSNSYNKDNLFIGKITIIFQANPFIKYLCHLLKRWLTQRQKGNSKLNCSFFSTSVASECSYLQSCDPSSIQYNESEMN